MTARPTSGGLGPTAAPEVGVPLTGRAQGLRYLVVGGWNTLFGYAAFAVLNALIGDDIGYMLVLPPATALAILNAYVGYRTFVFRVHGHWWRDLVRFSLVYVGAFAANLVLLPLLVEVLDVPILLAQAIVTAGTVIASFFGHRSFSFRRRPPTP